jgi:putative SOS response-associated peptidase YedK
VWPLSSVQTQAIDRGILRDRQRGRLGASLQHRPVAACRNYSPGSIQPERHFSLARWGLIPSWASDASIGFKTINARAETVASKPAFRDAFVSRRCLLPADGFFEWRRSGREKQPFHFGMQDDSLFAFAGLWDRWRDPAGAVIESCSILTTTPNSLLADIHDRMPVILRQENYDLWLDPGFKDVKALAEVLVPFDARR